MGLMTLEDFRTDLQSALGDRGIDNPRLDRWINHAYMDLTGGVRFEDLTEINDSETVAGVATISRPTDTRKVLIVKDVTNDNLLGWIPKNEYLRRSSALSGIPENWTEIENLIYLYPKPSGVLSIMTVYLRDPVPLQNPTDLTDISAVWDTVIWMLSVRYGLMALGEEQRASFWLSNALAYIQSKLTEDEIQAMTSGLGRSLPNTMAQLLAAAQNLPSTGG